MTVAEAIRKQNPRLRRTMPVAIEVNTAARRVYGCLCGASVSCCNKYPPTKRVLAFVAAHNATCCPVTE
jgi:hypothetical protein